MIESLVMTIMAVDRPGLVEQIAACVADRGCSWQESRMCHLEGRFAGLIRIEAPIERVAELKDALQALEADGIHIVVETGGGAPAAAGISATLELVGNDRPGILRAVTGVLASQGVNVEELSSECVSAPMGGGDLFQAKARVLVPANVKLESVRSSLEKIAQDLMVDLKLYTAGKR